MESKWNALYFIAFLVLGIFMMLNLIFVEVFKSYRKFCRLDFSEKMDLRDQGLVVAYRCLANGEAVLEQRKFEKFIKQMYPFARKHVISKITSKLLNGGSKITLESFMQLDNLLQLEITNKDKSGFTRMANKISAWVMQLPQVSYLFIRMHEISKTIQSFKLYKALFNLILLVQASTLTVSIHLELQRDETILVVNGVLFSCFLIEWILDIFSQDIFNGSNLMSPVHFALQSSYVIFGIIFGLQSDVSLILQALICIRLYTLSQNISSILNRLMGSLKYFFMNMLFVVVVMFVFNILGMWLFSGLLVPVSSLWFQEP
jgi:hypothetical protein